MIVDTLIISLILALLAGGRLSNLTSINIRAIWLVFLSVILNYGGQWLYERGFSWIGSNPFVYLASLVAVLVFVWLNRSLPGFVVAGIGILCNTLVIAANGGHMPVSLDTLHSAGLDAFLEPLQNGSVFTHITMEPGAKLTWLGDILALKPPYPRPKALSIGDIILALGVLNFVMATLRPWPLRRSAGVTTAHEPPVG